jgi:hypothetical protein
MYARSTCGTATDPLSCAKIWRGAVLTDFLQFSRELSSWHRPDRVTFTDHGFLLALLSGS